MPASEPGQAVPPMTSETQCDSDGPQPAAAMSAAVAGQPASLVPPPPPSRRAPVNTRQLPRISGLAAFRKQPGWAGREPAAEHARPEPRRQGRPNLRARASLSRSAAAAGAGRRDPPHDALGPAVRGAATANVIRIRGPGRAAGHLFCPQ